MALQISSKNEQYIYRIIFFLIFGIAIYIRWPHLFNENIWPDEALYGWYAQKISLHPLSVFSRGIIEFHPPLFSVFLAISHLFYQSEIGYRFVPFVFNLLGIIGIYSLGKKIHNQFLGVFSAILLAFNYLYLSAATKILIDGTFTTCTIFLALYLTEVRNSAERKHLIIIGTISGVLLLLKWSGILVIPFLLFYFLLIFSDQPVKKRLQHAAIPLSIVCFVLLMLLLNNLMQLKMLWPDISALQGQYVRKPFWYYAVNLHNVIMIPYLVPFFIVGMAIVIWQRKKEYLLIGIWFVVFFLGISFTGEKDLRYALHILAPAILITGLGVEAFILNFNRLKKHILAIRYFILFVLIATFSMLFPRTHQYLQMTDKTFTGFDEAGAWIKQHAGHDAYLIAGSSRILRYYTGIEYREFGGHLASLPESIQEFENEVKQGHHPCVVEVDFWERTKQPEWIYPVTEQKVKSMEILGFRLSKTIEREYEVSRLKSFTGPVIWLFLKE